MTTTRRPCWTPGVATVHTYAEPLGRTVRGAWCAAGLLYGSIVGATFGAAVTLAAGLWFLVPVGTLAGLVNGGLVGLLAGAANGTTLTLLAASPAWRSAPEDRARRAGITAISTTGATVACLQVVLLRSAVDPGVLLLLDLPMLVALAVAAYLTRHLPPVA